MLYQMFQKFLAACFFLFQTLKAEFEVKHWPIALICCATLVSVHWRLLLLYFAYRRMICPMKKSDSATSVLPNKSMLEQIKSNFDKRFLFICFLFCLFVLFSDQWRKRWWTEEIKIYISVMLDWMNMTNVGQSDLPSILFTEIHHKKFTAMEMLWVRRIEKPLSWIWE